MSFDFNTDKGNQPLTLPEGSDPTFRVNPLQSMRVQASLFAAALCGLVALVIVFVTSTLASGYLRDQVGRNFEVEAHQIAERLDTELYERQREIQLLAESWPEYAVDRDAAGAMIDAQRALLENLRGSNRAYSWIGYVAVDGAVLFAVDGLLEGADVSDRPWFINAMNGNYMGDVHEALLLAQLLPNPANEPMRFIDIASPVRNDEGEVIAVLGAHLNWAWMEAFVEQVGENLDSVRGTPKTTEVFIVDRTDLALSVDESSSLRAETRTAIALIGDRHSNQQYYDVIQWPDGQYYVTGFARGGSRADFEGLGWGVVVRQTEQDALIPVAQIQIVLIATGIVTTLVALVGGYYVASRLARPLAVLTESAETMLGGNLAIRFPDLESRNEVGVLTLALNQLLSSLDRQNQQLSQSNATLEQRIAERTAALERRARELADEVSTRKQLETALMESRESFRRLAETQLDGLMVIVEGIIIYSNQAVSEIFGYEQWELVRMSEHEFIATEDHPLLEKLYSQTDQRLYEVTGIRKDGDLFPLEVSGRLVSYSGSMSKVLTLRDISERKYAEIEIQKLLELAQHRLEEVQSLNSTLEYRSTHDHLTGLANRQFFETRLDDAIQHAPETGLGAAVLYLDLDHFKEVNDLLGHNAGDEVLKQVTTRMQSAITINKLLARTGGDEFAVMIMGVSRRAEAAEFARQMLALFEAPFSVRGRDVHLTASIGISFFPEHGHTVEVLLRKADLALYLAKMQGRSTFRMVDESAEIDLLAQMQLEVDLRQALERGELSLNYQPIASAEDERVYCVEALLRWTHPTLGLISPARFIPLAEISNTILPIGRWVAVEACRQAQHWRQEGLDVRVAINVSPRQFEDESFLESIDRALTVSGLPADRLEIEVTESLLIRDIEQKANVLNQLNERGVRLAIDDFGTGFSSLHHLQKLPIDTLKIDRSFIADLEQDKPNQSRRASAIINAICQMAHSLEMQVVAEGIETRFQFDTVRELKCDSVQGYLLGRPLPKTETEVILRKQGLTLP